MPEPTPEAWAHIRYDYEHTDRPVEDICAEHGISSGTLRDRVRRWRWTRRRPPIPRDGPPPVPMAQREIASPPPIRAANGGEGQRRPLAAVLPDENADAKHRLWVGGLCAVQTAEPSPPTPLRLANASRSDPPRRFAGGGMEHAAPPRHASEMDDARSSERESRETAPHTQSGEKTDAPAESGPASIVPRLQSAVARVLPAIEAIIARLAAGPQHPREMEQAGRALSSLTRTLRELNALLSQHNAHANDDDPIDIDAFRYELARRINAFCESEAAADDEAKPQET